MTLDRHFKQLRELSGSLKAHRRRVKEISEVVSRHKAGSVGQPDKAYAALGLRHQEANAAIQKDEQEVRLVLKWIAEKMGILGLLGQETSVPKRRPGVGTS